MSFFMPLVLDIKVNLSFSFRKSRLIIHLRLWISNISSKPKTTLVTKIDVYITLAFHFSDSISLFKFKLFLVAFSP